MAVHDRRNTHTASDGSTSVTRTKQYTPDLAHCRYSEIVTEPSSNLYRVTEDIGYDKYGNVSSDQITGVGMAARTTLATWFDGTYTTGQFPLNVTDASGATTIFTYDYGQGLLSTAKDPNGQLTSWQYTDGFGRKTKETRPDGTSTVWAYTLCSGCDPLPRMVITEQSNDTSGNVITTATHYRDMLDRPLYELSTLLGGTTATTTQKYDPLGRILTRDLPYSGTSVGQMSFGYDVLNRVTQVQRPKNASNSSPVTTNYQYAGDTTTIHDYLGNLRTLIKDPNGWLRESADAYSYAIMPSYDAAGSKTLVKDSLGNTLWQATGPYVYGIRPFLPGFTDMDRGTWSFTVDALGETTAWTDAKGQQFSQTYDPLSRPFQRKEPDLFTQWTWGSSPSLNNVGLLQSVCTGLGSGPSDCTTSPGLSESRTYDANARPSQRTIKLPGGVSYTYTWTYSGTTGFLDTLTYPVSTCGFSFAVKYGYSAGILASITDASHTPGAVLWQANAQNAAGQLTQETINNGSIVVNRAFDAVTHLLASVQAGAGGGTGSLNQSFLYDDMGNVIERQDNSSLALTEDAYYDNDYRLTSTKLNGNTSLSITYDNTMGNIVARNDVAGGANWTYSPTQKHAVTQAGNSSFAYAYDSNGNVTSRQGQMIYWSSSNYPTTISAGSGSTAEAVSFSYGPDRSRWQQIYTGNGTTETTNYIGGLMDVVISGASVDYRHYIYAGSEPVAVYSRKGSGVNAFSYFLTDHQSSVAKIVAGSTGAVAASESFTPFGNRRDPSTWSGSPTNGDLTATAGFTRQGYTFQTQLGLWMGLNHMNGRVEDSVTGRFLAADPSVTDPTNPQDYNRYSYARNNPLTYSDPSGFTTTTYQFREDWLWGYASFGQETTCAGICGSGAALGTAGAAASSGGRTQATTATMSVTGDPSLVNTPQGPPPPPGTPAQGDPSPGSQPTSEVDVNAPRNIVPDANHLTADLTGSFLCGSFKCSYQMGQLVGYDRRGVWINVNVGGSTSKGRWVQTFINTSTSQFTTDCVISSCPYYPSYASSGDWFYDGPNSPSPAEQIWVAQASLLRPEGGAEFTFMWGYILLGNGGPAMYIPPVAVSPWNGQQELIRRAQ